MVTAEWIEWTDDSMVVVGAGGGCGRGDLRGTRCGGVNGDGVFLHEKYSDLGEGVRVRSAKSLGDQLMGGAGDRATSVW